MNSYLITYDLRKPGQDYDELSKYLAKLGAVKAQLSVWLVRTSASAVQIRDAIMARVDDNDRVLVVAVTTPGAWHKLLPGASDWLHNNL